MRLELNEYGKIVCTMENVNHAFLSDCQYSLHGFDERRRLRFSYFGDEDREKWSYPEVGEEQDYLTLSDVLYSARKNGVEISEEVLGLHEKWQKTYFKCELRRKQEEAERQRRLQMPSTCRDCEYCRQDCDTFICGYSGVVLPEKRGAWKNEYVYLPFYPVPIPTDGCKYQGKGDTL